MELDAAELTFRRSGLRLPAALAGVALVSAVAAVLLQVVVFDNPWSTAIPQLAVIVVFLVGLYLRARRETGLPLRLTPEHLVLTRPGGKPPRHRLGPEHPAPHQ